MYFLLFAAKNIPIYSVSSPLLSTYNPQILSILLPLEFSIAFYLHTDAPVQAITIICFNFLQSFRVSLQVLSHTTQSKLRSPVFLDYFQSEAQDSYDDTLDH